MFVYIDELNKICDQLLNFEISKEDLLKMNECEIDYEKISKKPKLDQGSKKSKNVAKAEAAEK